MINNWPSSLPLPKSAEMMRASGFGKIDADPDRGQIARFWLFLAQARAAGGHDAEAINAFLVDGNGNWAAVVVIHGIHPPGAPAVAGAPEFHAADARWAYRFEVVIQFEQSRIDHLGPFARREQAQFRIGRRIAGGLILIADGRIESKSDTARGQIDVI